MRPTIKLVLEALLLLALFVSSHYDFFNIPILKVAETSSPVKAIFNFSIFALIVDFTRRAIKYSYSKRNGQNLNVKDNFHFGVDNIAKLLLGFGIIITLFGVFGVDFKSLVTSLSIVAAAIAIITKEYINDFLVGIYFSFSQNFDINDYVKIGEYKGKIVEIDMLKIKILNDDDDLVIIPNGKVYNNEIINYTKRDIRLMSIDFQIDIKLVDNIQSLENDLINTLQDFGDYIEPNTYNLKIVEMRKDHLDLKFKYSLKKLDRDVQRLTRKKTVREVFSYISSKNK